MPTAQRFGPGLAPGTSTRDVFGVGVNGKARVDTLSLDGEVRSTKGTIALGGLNQYALPVDGVGLFTADWGPPPGSGPPAAPTRAAATRAAPTPTR